MYLPLAGTLECQGCGSCLVLSVAKVPSVLVNCCMPSMVLGEEEGEGRRKRGRSKKVEGEEGKEEEEEEGGKNGGGKRGRSMEL